jgi:hypothetical protein
VKKSGFPKTVLVAVSVNSLYLIAGAERETRFGLVARLENFALVSLFRLKTYPFYIMVRDHRMRDGTHFHGDDAVFNRKYGNVLFHSRVNGVGYYFGHFFAAAKYGHAARFHIRYNIAAMLADVKFDFHKNTPFPLSDKNHCTSLKASFGIPHIGHTQSSGKSSHFVPGLMPASGIPFASS